MKKLVKDNFESTSKPISDLIVSMHEHKIQNMIEKENKLEASHLRSLSQSTYQKQVPISR